MNSPEVVCCKPSIAQDASWWLCCWLWLAACAAAVQLLAIDRLHAVAAGMSGWKPCTAPELASSRKGAYGVCCCKVGGLWWVAEGLHWLLQKPPNTLHATVYGDKTAVAQADAQDRGSLP